MSQEYGLLVRHGRRQRGHGLFSSIFRSLSKIAVPATRVLKSVVSHPIAKNAMKSVGRAGVETIADILEGQDGRDAITQNITKARKRIANDLRSELTSNASVARKRRTKKRKDTRAPLKKMRKSIL